MARDKVDVMMLAIGLALICLGGLLSIFGPKDKP